MNMTELLAQKLPGIIRRNVAVGVSSDEDARKDKTGTVCNVTMIFDETWTVGDLIDRLMSSNSPKVSVQAVLRKKGNTCPKHYEWKVNKSGARSTPDAREMMIDLLMSKGLSRDKAIFVVDHADQLDDVIPAE